MVTIKSYTDLPQSRRLAKILNHESTDMRYEACYVSPKEGIIEYESHPHFAKCIENCIPCWSLAALLNEIPEIINFDDDESDYALETLKENGLYYLSYGNPFEHNKVDIEPQENFVDACYEMIEKLHELKML